MDIKLFGRFRGTSTKKDTFGGGDDGAFVPSTCPFQIA